MWSICVGVRALEDASVHAHHLAFSAVTSAAIAKHAVTAVHIAPGSVNADALATDSVGADQIQPAAVTSAELAPHAVQRAAISPSAVGPQQLAEASVMAPHLQQGAVHLQAISPKLRLGVEVVLLAALALSLFSFAVAIFALRHAARANEAQRELLAYMRAPDRRSLASAASPGMSYPSPQPITDDPEHACAPRRVEISPSADGVELEVMVRGAHDANSAASLLSNLLGGSKASSYRRLADDGDSAQASQPPPPQRPPRLLSPQSPAVTQPSQRRVSIDSHADSSDSRGPASVLVRTDSNQSAVTLAANLATLAEHRVAEHQRPAAQNRDSPHRATAPAAPVDRNKHGHRPIVGSSHNVLGDCRSRPRDEGSRYSQQRQARAPAAVQPRPATETMSPLELMNRAVARAKAESEAARRRGKVDRQ